MDTLKSGFGSERSKLAGKSNDALVHEVVELRRRILELEHQEMERQQTNTALTQINEMLPRFCQRAERSLGEGIAIEMRLAADLWPTMVDVEQLKTALLELVTNARDAMPEGGRLIIETANQILQDDDTARHADLAPGNYVLIAVSDSGPGMPAEVLAQVFEPFFTSRDPGGGRGLGLNRVRGFTKQSEGHVSISSVAGDGATVLLYLPRGEETATVEQIPGKSRPDRPTGSETIIVVEDNEDMRSYLVRALSRLGYTVLEAEDGPAALEVMATAGGIDLLLTDMNLPRGMNGRDIAAAFQEKYPAAGVLYASGHTRDVLGRQGQLDEDMAFIYKPFQASVLAQRVREVLDSR